VAVALRSFWDRFFEAGNHGEWYIPSSVAFEYVAPHLQEADVVVHGGAGASLLVRKVRTRLVPLLFVFAGPAKRDQ
jgi:hypothetical protein